MRKKLVDIVWSVEGPVWGEEVEKEHKLNSSGSTSKVEIVKPPPDERLWAALKFGGYIAKQILSILFVRPCRCELR